MISKITIQNEKTGESKGEFDHYIVFGFNDKGLSMAGHYTHEGLMLVLLEVQKILLGLSEPAEGERQTEK